MNHTSVRIICDRDKLDQAPPDVVRENEILDWSEYVYVTAMRTVAAGVLLSDGSLDKAASVLEWTGFEVPPGLFFDEDHPAFDLMGHDLEALQAYVEADEEGIRGLIGTEVFDLAAHGKLLDRSRLPTNSPSAVSPLQTMKNTQTGGN